MIEQIEMRIDINNILNTIPERSAKIVTMRICDEMEYKDIGKVFNIGAERVRQIEAKALRQLRNPSRTRELNPNYHKVESKINKEVDEEKRQFYIGNLDKDLYEVCKFFVNVVGKSSTYYRLSKRILDVCGYENNQREIIMEAYEDTIAIYKKFKRCI